MGNIIIKTEVGLGEYRMFRQEGKKTRGRVKTN